MKRVALDGEFNFSEEQKERLEKIAEVKQLDKPASAEDWLKSVKGFDVVCTWGDHVIENLNNLENVLVTYPYTELGSFDSKALEKNGVYVANARGGNKKSIVEWTMFMILSLYRRFPEFLRTTKQYPFTATESLEGKNVLIVGHGTIGTEVGERCESFGMIVTYFDRGDDLLSLTKDADVVVNALNSGPTNKNLSIEVHCG